MGYGNKKASGFTKHRFITFLLVLALIWLFLSTIADSSPLKTIGSISDLFKSDPDPITRLNRDQLISLVGDKDREIDSLVAVIDSYKLLKEKDKAIIDIESDKLNVRSGPSINTEVIIRIPDSTVVEILYFDKESFTIDGRSGSWCKISYKNMEGWVWGNYLRRVTI